MTKVLLLAITAALLIRAARLAFRPSPPAGTGPETAPTEASSLELRRCDRCGEYSLPGTRLPTSFVCASCRRSAT